MLLAAKSIVPRSVECADLQNKWKRISFRHSRLVSKRFSSSAYPISSKSVYTPPATLWPPNTQTETYKKLKHLVEQSSPNSSSDSINSHLNGSETSKDSIRHWKSAMPMPGSPAETVIEAFERNRNTKAAIPPYTMSIIISAYGKLELGHRALDLVLFEVEKRGFKPHKKHLTNLIGALGRSGDLESSLSLYHLMLNYDSDCITFITVVDMLSRANHSELAFQLWKEWRISPPVSPVVNVYTTIAEASIKARNFGVFQEAELDARKQFHDALNSKRLSRIISSQYTPKHCVHVSNMLGRFWLPTLRPIIPENLKLTIHGILQSWSKIRPALPGTPLIPSEIQKWESDMDLWMNIQRDYSPSIDAGSSLNLPLDDHDESWFQPSLVEDDDDASLDALILEYKSRK